MSVFTDRQRDDDSLIQNRVSAQEIVDALKQKSQKENGKEPEQEQQSSGDPKFDALMEVMKSIDWKLWEIYMILKANNGGI